MKPIRPFWRSLFFPLMLGLPLLACQPRENEQVVCPRSDQECRDESSAGGAEPISADAEENSGERAGAALWSLDAGGMPVQGTIGFAGSRDGRLAVQLVSDDAVNLWLVVPDDKETVRQAEMVLLAFGRGNRCRYVSGDPAEFTIRFDQTEPMWVSGQFDGPVQCEGEATSIRTSGTFRVSNSQ